MSPHTRGVLMTVCAAIVWSTGGLFVKLITLDAFTILFYRSLYAAIFFLIVFRKDALLIDRRIILTSLSYAPLLICFVVATKLTTAANAIFLQYVAPAIVLLLEPRIMKTKLEKFNVITVVICILGLSFFLFEQKGSHGWFGDGIALISGLFLAFLILSLKLSNKQQQMSGITFGNILIVLITLPVFLNSGPPTTSEHLMFAFLGLVQIGLGYALFTYGQRRISAIESSLIAMLEPLLNPVWVMIGYGEWPSLWSVAGGFIILSAIAGRMLYVHQFITKRENVTQET